jgi:beta-mannosidase
VVTVPLPAGVRDADDTEVLVVDDGENRAWWFPAEDRDIAWPPAAYDAEVFTADGATQVTVTARTFLRSLILYPDRLDPSAQVDDADVTLFPGESVTFTVTGAADLDADASTRPPVLRCVNDIHASPPRDLGVVVGTNTDEPRIRATTTPRSRGRQRNGRTDGTAGQKADF